MVQEHKRISGMSGNEIFFLERMGYRPVSTHRIYMEKRFLESH